MEINQPLDGEIHSLDVTPESRSYLLEAAKWARFVSIVGFVFLGLFALVFLFLGGNLFASGFADELGGEFGAMGGVATFLYLAFMGAILFFPNYYMYNFSSRIITAINSKSSLDLTDGFKNLKSLFKFYGIMFAIILGFYVLAFIGVGVGSMMM